MKRQRCRDSNALSGHNFPEFSAICVWCRKTQRRGSVTILRHRVITPDTQRTGSTHSACRRRRRYQVSSSCVCTCICWLARLPCTYSTRVLLACLSLAAPAHARSAQLEVSSSPPPKARPARPRSCLLHACSFSRPSSAAFPLANLLPHPRSARLLLQPYQLQLSFHYTLIPAHVPAFPSSQPCAAYRSCG